MRYVFYPEAVTEYAEAVQYYTQQRVEVARSRGYKPCLKVRRMRSSADQYTVFANVLVFAGVNQLQLLQVIHLKPE